MVSEKLGIFFKLRGRSISPGGPRSVSLNGPDHNEQEYIWFRGVDLNGF